MSMRRPLTESQRDYLLLHLDGKRVLLKKTGERASGEYHTITSLMNLGYLQMEPVPRPTYTEITDAGRGALAAALADWAEAIALHAIMLDEQRATNAATTLEKVPA